jgi:thiamine-monophosphate kinase
VPREQALRRDGATAGDKIYVSGTLGDAGLGLQVAKGKHQLVNHDHDFIVQRLNQPTPRVELGLLLRDVASSAIDISDGLLADLNHIMQLSHLGAEINANLLPLSSTLRKKLSSDAAKKLALTAGDDYELCFTVSPAKEKILLDKLKADNHHVTCIGVMTREPGIRLLGYADDITSLGYLHFSQDKS